MECFARKSSVEAIAMNMSAAYVKAAKHVLQHAPIGRRTKRMRRVGATRLVRFFRFNNSAVISVLSFLSG